FPQEARHLVVAGADAPEQVLDTAGGVPDTERLIDPEANLIGAAAAPRADLLLEALDLCCGEGARVAPVMQRAEGVEAAVAEHAQPVGELPHATAKQVGDLGTGLAVGHPEHGREALVEALVVRLVTATFEFSPLLRVEMNRLHRAHIRAG